MNESNSKFFKISCNVFLKINKSITEFTLVLKIKLYQTTSSKTKPPNDTVLTYCSRAKQDWSLEFARRFVVSRRRAKQATRVQSAVTKAAAALINHVSRRRSCDQFAISSSFSSKQSQGAFCLSPYKMLLPQVPNIFFVCF